MSRKWQLIFLPFRGMPKSIFAIFLTSKQFLKWNWWAELTKIFYFFFKLFSNKLLQMCKSTKTIMNKLLGTRNSALKHFFMARFVRTLLKNSCKTQLLQETKKCFYHNMTLYFDSEIECILCKISLVSKFGTWEMKKITSKNNDRTHVRVNSCVMRMV